MNCSAGEQPRNGAVSPKITNNAWVVCDAPALVYVSLVPCIFKICVCSLYELEAARRTARSYPRLVQANKVARLQARRGRGVGAQRSLRRKSKKQRQLLCVDCVSANQRASNFPHSLLWILYCSRGQRTGGETYTAMRSGALTATARLRVPRLRAT